jgi:acetyl-CoA synthetase
MSYYKIENLRTILQHYNKSVREPRKFWGKIAEENLLGINNGTKFDFNMAEGDIKWFTSKIKHNKTVLTGI